MRRVGVIQGSTKRAVRHGLYRKNMMHELLISPTIRLLDITTHIFEKELTEVLNKKERTYPISLRNLPLLNTIERTRLPENCSM